MTNPIENPIGNDKSPIGQTTNPIENPIGKCSIPIGQQKILLKIL